MKRNRTGKTLNATAPGTRYWLMKSEPNVFSIDDLQKKKSEPWDGVRNYQARNFMKEMQVGDKVLFYHSNAKPRPGVAGTATVCKAAYPDHTALDSKSKYYHPKHTKENPIWYMVDVKYDVKFAQVQELDDLRKKDELSGMMLFTHQRLSVQSCSKDEFDFVVKLGTAKAAKAAKA